jgi:hypothetical protein
MLKQIKGYLPSLQAFRGSSKKLLELCNMYEGQYTREAISKDTQVW